MKKIIWVAFFIATIYDLWERLYLGVRLYIFDANPFNDFEWINVGCLLVDIASLVIIVFLFMKLFFRSNDNKYLFFLTPIATLSSSLISLFLRMSILSNLYKDKYGFAFGTFSWKLGSANVYRFLSRLETPYICIGVLICVAMIVFGYFCMNKENVFANHEKVPKGIHIVVALIILGSVALVASYDLSLEPEY